ncbi:MAG: alpha/beta hydrolase family protein [Ferruginibacter sp.]
MAKHFFVLICLFSSHLALMSQSVYQRGYRSITFNDPSRSGRAIATDIYYPANTAGTNVPVASGTTRFPVVVFGHGFSLPASAYTKLADTLTRNGYIAAFPTTETGLAPSHDNFGKDISYLCTAIIQLDGDPTSFLYQRVTSKAAVGGHSMGGGCSFLAAASGNANIQALFNMAAAETSPSATTAASSVNIPTLIFSGSNDCIVPPATQQAMYNNIPGSCKSQITITGATHCQIADNNFTCVFGQISSGCNSSPISVNTVYSKTADLLIPFLDYTLNGNCLRGVDYVNKLSTATGATAVTNCPVPNCAILPVRIRHFSGYFSKKVQLFIEAEAHSNAPDPIDVEKSLDGIHFKPWKTVTVIDATTSILLTDETFFSPFSFYRLKTNQTSSPVYSSVVAIRTSEIPTALILTNPLRDHTLSLKMQSASPEILQIRIFTNDGKCILQKNRSIGAGTSVLYFELPTYLSGHCILEYSSLKSQQAKHLSFFKGR